MRGDRDLQRAHLRGAGLLGIVEEGGERVPRAADHDQVAGVDDGDTHIVRPAEIVDDGTAEAAHEGEPVVGTARRVHRRRALYGEVDQGGGIVDPGAAPGRQFTDAVAGQDEASAE